MLLVILYFFLVFLVVSCSCGPRHIAALVANQTVSELLLTPFGLVIQLFLSFVLSMFIFLLLLLLLYFSLFRFLFLSSASPSPPSPLKIIFYFFTSCTSPSYSSSLFLLFTCHHLFLPRIPRRLVLVWSSSHRCPCR